MILEVAKQYKDNKVRYEDARDVIKLLTSLNYKTQQSKRPDDAYNNLMQKARGRLPISADVIPPRANARTLGKKRKALPRATVSVKCVLFGEPQAGDMPAIDNAVVKRIVRKYNGLHQKFSGKLEIPDADLTLLDSVKGKLVLELSTTAKTFGSLKNEFMKNESFEERERYAPGYITGILVLKIDNRQDIIDAIPINPRDTKKRTDCKESCNYSYITTTLDLSQDTLEKTKKNIINIEKMNV
jgi:hypothetical protein